MASTYSLVGSDRELRMLFNGMVLHLNPASESSAPRALNSSLHSMNWMDGYALFVVYWLPRTCLGENVSSLRPERFCVEPIVTQQRS